MLKPSICIGEIYRVERGNGGGDWLMTMVGGGGWLVGGDGSCNAWFWLGLLAFYFILVRRR